jgi:hypothetical protein
MINTPRRKLIEIKQIDKLKNTWDCCHVSSYFRQRSALELNNLLTRDHTYFYQILTIRLRCVIRVTPLTYYKTDISASNKTVNVRINLTLKCVLSTIVVAEKQQALHIPTVCVLASGTQREILMNNISICGLTGCTTFFYIIPQMARFSKKKTKLLKTKRIFIFSTTLVETFLNLIRNERDMIKYVF